MRKYIFILFFLFHVVVLAQQRNKNPYARKNILVYTTTENTNFKLSLTDTLQFRPEGPLSESQTCIFVYPEKTFQTILGIGGAITDASAETFAKLPQEKQQEILTAYYDAKKGIGYTLARINMNSCDFSSSSYTYIQEGDKELKTFSIDHDKTFKIPLIKKAMAATGNKLVIFASPWSPPAFMKDNNNMLHGGKLISSFYQAWADYFVKFIRAYQKEKINIWGVTIQNEPMANQKWESCLFTAEEEKEFLKKYLGPTFQREKLQDKKIIIWDHNRDFAFERAAAIFQDPVASKYAWGLGFHWYEDWSGGQPMYENIKRVHEAFPGKNILFTEGCNGPFSRDSLNNWKLGENYGMSMINDFNCGVTGWTDWNILLDESGGPNHVGNYCFAPVIANTKTGEIIYTNAYYYLGHFSKFIRPGARRISSSPTRSSLLSAAFINPDGSISVVVMNQTDKEQHYYLHVAGKAVFISILPHSIQTLVF